MEEPKTKKTKKKREVDLVSVISIILVTVIICLFNSWLYYDAKIKKMKETYSTRTMILEREIDDLSNKNQALQLSLDKFNADIQKAQKELEENQ